MWSSGHHFRQRRRYLDVGEAEPRFCKLLDQVYSRGIPEQGTFPLLVDAFALAVSLLRPMLLLKLKRLPPSPAARAAAHVGFQLGAVEQHRIDGEARPITGPN